MPIEFAPETRQRLYDKLQQYCLDEFGEDLGVLRTEKLFEFVVGNIGTSIYNQALTDAQAWMQDKLLDLEGDLHQHPDDVRK